MIQGIAKQAVLYTALYRTVHVRCATVLDTYSVHCTVSGANILLVVPGYVQ